MLPPPRAGAPRRQQELQLHHAADGRDASHHAAHGHPEPHRARRRRRRQPRVARLQRDARVAARSTSGRSARARARAGDSHSRCDRYCAAAEQAPATAPAATAAAPAAAPTAVDLRYFPLPLRLHCSTSGLRIACAYVCLLHEQYWAR